ncbi:ROK family protein [candidate division KSB1 bacterium]
MPALDWDGIWVKLYSRITLEGKNTAVPEQADRLIRLACKKTDIDIKDIKAVGISTCSPFKNIDGSKTIVSPNLCGGMIKERGLLPNDWTFIPLEGYLSGKYKDVRTGNDCVTSVVAEHKFGAGRGYDNLVYVTWSTGVGTGIIIDGHLIRGKNGNAAHGGHIYLTEDGPLCGCGNYGDLESLTSGTNIALAYDNDATTEDVFSAYRAGEEKAVKLIDRAVRNFARGLASINVLTDTEIFILGGSVYFNNEELLLPKIKEEFYRSFTVLSEGVEFRTSELFTYLGDIAALSLVLSEEWHDHWNETKPWKNAPETLTVD